MNINKFHLKYYVLFLLFTLTFLTFTQDNKVSIVTDEERKGNYLVEITFEALKRTGYEPKIKFMPWARALYLTAEHSEFDILLGGYYSSQRAEKMYTSVPIGKTEVTFLTLKEHKIKYSSLNDLRGYKIACIRSTEINEEFDNADFLLKDFSPSIETNVEKLFLKRVHLVIDKKEKLIQIVSEKHPDRINDIAFLTPPLSVNNYYNYFPKNLPNSTKLLSDFNRGLKMIQEDGTYLKILQKHKITQDITD